MSYCSTVSFNLGFGSQPGNVIRNSVNNASCLFALNGSTAICSGSSYTFSVSNAPNGFTWNKSSNLNLSGSGTSITVSATSGTNAAGWNTNSESQPTSYQWILNPQLNNNLYGTNTVSLDIAFYTAGNHQLVVNCNVG